MVTQKRRSPCLPGKVTVSFFMRAVYLLQLGFAGNESVSTLTSQTDIGIITAGYLIVSITAQNAIIAAQSIDRIDTGTSKDQVVACRAVDRARPSHDVRQGHAANRRLEILGAH